MRKGSSAVNPKTVEAADEKSFVSGFLSGDICASVSEAPVTSATAEGIKEIAPNAEHPLPGHVPIEPHDSLTPASSAKLTKAAGVEEEADDEVRQIISIARKLPSKLDTEFKTSLVKKADRIAARSHSVPPQIVKRPLRTEEQTYNEMEKLKVQQELIREARVAIATTTKLGNGDKIFQLLYGTFNAEKPEYEFGDEETYLKVNEIVRTHAFSASHSNSAHDTATLEQRVTSTREENDVLRKKMREMSGELKQSILECKSLRLLLDERNEETMRLRQQVSSLQVQVRNAQVSGPSGNNGLNVHRQSFTAMKKIEAKENEMLDLQRDFAMMAEANWKLEQENRSLRVRIATGAIAANPPQKRDMNALISNATNTLQDLNAADARSRQMFMAAELPQTSKIVQLTEARRVWQKRLATINRNVMEMLDFDVNQTGRKATLFGASGMLGERGRRSTGGTSAVDDGLFRVASTASSVFEDVVRDSKKSNSTMSSPVGRSGSIAMVDSVQGSSSPPAVVTAKRTVTVSAPPAPTRDKAPAEASSSKKAPPPLIRPTGPEVESPQDLPFSPDSPVGVTSPKKMPIAAAAQPKVKTENCWAALRSTVQSHFLISRAECLRREELHIRTSRQALAVLRQEVDVLSSERDAAQLRSQMLERNLAHTTAMLQDSTHKSDSLHEELERVRRQVLRLQGVQSGAGTDVAKSIDLNTKSKKVKLQLRRLESRHLANYVDPGEASTFLKSSTMVSAADVEGLTMLVSELQQANRQLEDRLTSLNRIFDSRVASLQGEIESLEEQLAAADRRSALTGGVVPPAAAQPVATPLAMHRTTSSFTPIRAPRGTIVAGDGSSVAQAAAAAVDSGSVKQLRRQIEALKEELSAANRAAEGLRRQVRSYEDSNAERNAKNALGINDRTAAVVVSKLMRWCNRCRERIRRRAKDDEVALRQQQLAELQPLQSQQQSVVDPDEQLVDSIRDLVGSNPGGKYLLDKLRDAKLRADAAIRNQPDLPTESTTQASRLRRAFLKLLIHREETLLETNSYSELVEKTYDAMLRVERLMASEFAQLALKGGAAVYQSMLVSGGKEGNDDEPLLMDMRTADQTSKEALSLKTLLSARVELSEAIDSHRAAMLAKSSFGASAAVVPRGEAASATVVSAASICKKSILYIRHQSEGTETLAQVLLMYGVQPTDEMLQDLASQVPADVLSQAAAKAKLLRVRVEDLQTFQSLLDLTQCGFEVSHVAQPSDTEATVAARFLVNSCARRGMCFVASGTVAAREALSIASPQDVVTALIKPEMLDTVVASINSSKADVLRDSAALPKKTSLRVPLLLTRNALPFVKTQLLSVPGLVVIEHFVQQGQNVASIARLYDVPKSEKLPSECFPGTTVEVPVGSSFVLALHPYLAQETEARESASASSNEAEVPLNVEERWSFVPITTTGSVAAICQARRCAVDEVFVPNLDRIRGATELATFLVRLRSMQQVASATAQGMSLWGVNAMGTMVSMTGESSSPLEVSLTPSAEPRSAALLVKQSNFIADHSRVFAAVRAPATLASVSRAALCLGVKDARDVYPFKFEFSRSICPTVTLIRAAVPDSYIISFIIESQFFDLDDLAGTPHSAKLAEALELDVLQVSQCMVENPVVEIRSAHTYYIDHVRGRVQMGIRVKSQKSAGIIFSLVVNDGSSVMLPKTREVLLAAGKNVPHDDSDLEQCLTMKTRPGSVHLSAMYSARGEELAIALGQEDTLSDIALEYGVSVASLIASNGHVLLPLVEKYRSQLFDYLVRENLLPQMPLGLTGAVGGHTEDSAYDAIMDGLIGLLPLRSLFGVSYISVSALMSHTSLASVAVVRVDTPQTIFNFAASNACMASDVFADCAVRPGSTIYTVPPPHTTTLNGVRPVVTLSKFTVESGQSMKQLLDISEAQPRDVCVRNASSVMVPRGCAAISVACPLVDSEAFVKCKPGPEDTLFSLASRIGVSAKQIAATVPIVSSVRGSFLMLVPVCEKNRELLLSAVKSSNLVTTAPPYPDETIASNFDVPLDAVVTANAVRILADKKLVPVVTTACAATVRMQGLPLFVVVGLPREGTVASTAKRFQVPVGSIECGALPLVSCGVNDEITVPISLELANKLLTQQAQGANPSPVKIFLRAGNAKLVPESAESGKLPQAGLYHLTAEGQLRDHRQLLADKAQGMLALTAKLAVYDKYVDMVTTRIARCQAESSVVDRAYEAFKAANLLSKTANMNVREAHTQTVIVEPEKPDANSAVLIRPDMANPIKKPRKARDTMTVLTSASMDQTEEATKALEKRSLEKELQLQALRRSAAVTEAKAEQLEDDLTKAKSVQEEMEKNAAAAQAAYAQLEAKFKALEQALLHDGDDDEQDENPAAAEDGSPSGDSLGGSPTSPPAPVVPMIAQPVIVLPPAPPAGKKAAPAPGGKQAKDGHKKSLTVPSGSDAARGDVSPGVVSIAPSISTEQHEAAILAAAQAAREAALEEASKANQIQRKKANQKFIRAIYGHGKSVRQTKQHLLDIVEEVKQYVPQVFQMLFDELQQQLAQLSEVLQSQMHANDATWARRLYEAEHTAFSQGVQRGAANALASMPAQPQQPANFSPQQQMLENLLAQQPTQQQVLVMRNAVDAADAAPAANEPQIAWAQQELKEFLRTTMSSATPNNSHQQATSAFGAGGQVIPATFNTPQYAPPPTGRGPINHHQQQQPLAGGYTDAFNPPRIPTPPQQAAPQVTGSLLPVIARTGSGRVIQQQQSYQSQQVVPLPAIGGNAPPVAPLTLEYIARQQLLDVGELMRANPSITGPAQVLPPTEHVAMPSRPQEMTAADLAAFYSLTLPELLACNPTIRGPNDLIPPSQRVVIFAGGGPQALTSSPLSASGFAPSYNRPPAMAGMPPAQLTGRIFTPDANRIRTPQGTLKYDSSPKNYGSDVQPAYTHTAAMMRETSAIHLAPTGGPFASPLSPRPPAGLQAMTHADSMRSPKSQALGPQHQISREFVAISKPYASPLPPGALQQPNAAASARVEVLNRLLKQQQPMPSMVVKTEPALSVVLPVAEAVVKLGRQYSSADLSSARGTASIAGVEPSGGDGLAFAGGDFYLTPEELQKITQLQEADNNRRHRKNKLIFESVRTRIEAKRLMKLVERSVPEQGDAVSLFVTEMWKRWLEKWNGRRMTLVEERGAHLETLASIFVAKSRASSALSAGDGGGDELGVSSSQQNRFQSPGRNRTQHMQSVGRLPAAEGDSSHHFTGIATLSPTRAAASHKW